MVWRAEEIVNSRPVQVFHCEICDKYSAELQDANGVKTNVAPPITTATADSR